jgi:hypothetical protein
MAALAFVVAAVLTPARDHEEAAPSVPAVPEAA